MVGAPRGGREMRRRQPPVGKERMGEGKNKEEGRKPRKKAKPAGRDKRQERSLATDKKGQEPQSEVIEQVARRALCLTTAEVYLQQYPLFCLTPNKPTDTRITYTEHYREAGVSVTRTWSVYTHPEFGWPGEHEAEVWRALEHIIHLRQAAGKLENPITTSFAEIRKYMSGKGYGGTDVERIKHSLGCLGSTKVENNLYCYDSGKTNQCAAFTVIASLAYLTKELPDGREIIDRVRIELPDELFESICNRHVRPLDKGFRDGLRHWLARRLYELLGVKFYALRRKRQPYRTRYLRLCGFLGSKPQPRLSWAKRILGRAHQELLKVGFLEQVEWHEVMGEKRDWVLSYWPGPVARREWSKEYWLEEDVLELLAVERLPEIELEPVWVEELRDDEGAIEGEVVSDCPEEEPSGHELEVSGTPPVLPPQQDEAEEAEEAYARMAVQAFEQATGRHRRLAGLSKAERKCLAQWREAGVEARDILKGVELAQKEAKSWSGGGGGKIVSLAYVRGQVLDESRERQKQDALDESLYRVALERRTQEAEELEGEVWRKFLESGREEERCYREALVEEISLVEAKEGAEVVFVCKHSRAAKELRSWWCKELEEVCGREVLILSPREWVRRVTGGGARR
ncbi:MAG: hypothetical protein D6736_03280 [Nitrospinota bacterium]|nr:MAG: hypothetical protein D6736_03280 [Nitrospinota bacterium]